MNGLQSGSARSRSKMMLAYWSNIALLNKNLVVFAQQAASGGDRE